jgi:hypothetical protein
MNICFKHKKYCNYRKKKLCNNKQAGEDFNDISYKYFLCKFCGILINENDQVNNFLKKIELSKF